MSDKDFTPTFVEESKFVDVLTSSLSGDLIGYRIGGSRPGPNAVLAGETALTEALFERFITLPTLPWLWGCLYLVTLSSLESGRLHEVRKLLENVEIDGLVLLPYASDPGEHDKAVESAYWAGLRLCRQLGMIEGRGMGPSPGAPEDPL